MSDNKNSESAMHKSDAKAISAPKAKVVKDTSASTVKESSKEAQVSNSTLVSSGMSKGSKIALFSVIGVVILLGLFALLIKVAMSSNSNIPVVTTLANKLEMSLVNNEEYRRNEIEKETKDLIEKLQPYEDKELTYDEAQSFYSDALYSEVDQKMMNVKSRGEMSLVVDENQETSVPEINLSATLEGYSNGSDMDGNVQLDVETGGVTVNTDIQIRLLEEIYYMNIGDIPAISDQAPGLQDLFGQWLSMDISSLNDDLAKNSEETYSLTKENINMIEEVLTSDAVVNSVTYLEDRNFDGVQTRCTQYDFDEKDLAEIVNIANKYQDDDQKLTDADLQEMYDTFGDFNLIAEVCTGRGDNLPYYISIDVDVDGGSFNMNVEYYDYGVKEEIVAPKDAQPIDELLGGAISSVSPAINIAKSRDARRQSDVSAIMNALSQYAIDGNSLPELRTCPSYNSIGTGSYSTDLSFLVPTYLVTIPVDPQYGTQEDTDYNICADAYGRITVSALGENTADISVTR